MSVNLIGQTLSNRYRVDASLGSGGMGAVYRVWDSQRAVHLALKVLHGDLHERPELFQRLNEEAETLSRLQHPHIVRSYGLERDGYLAFILMDFIDGSTLKESIAQARGGPFDLPATIDLLQPVCVALHYAHEQGVVHCDVKPANILIDRTGRVLLTDFGLVCLVETTGTNDRYGGTPAYMSPEQVLRCLPTPQSDIYALGVILFEMLTGGTRPFNGGQASFSGNTPEKIRWEQVNLPVPSMRVFNQSVSGGLEGIIHRCLEKNPEHRYANTVDLLNDLQRVRFEQDTRKRAPVPISVSPSYDAPQSVSPLSKFVSSTQARPFPFRVLLFLLAIIFIILLVVNPFSASNPFSPIQNSAGNIVPSLEDKAPEPVVAKPEPGKTYTYTINLSAPVRLRWGYPWCAASQQILNENLADMRFDFIDRNQQLVSLDRFSIFNYKQGNLYCQVHYLYVVEGWADGHYQLSTDVTFLHPVNDGQDTYPAGTVKYSYDIQIGPTAVP